MKSTWGPSLRVSDYVEIFFKYRYGYNNHTPILTPQLPAVWGSWLLKGRVSHNFLAFTNHVCVLLMFSEDRNSHHEIFSSKSYLFISGGMTIIFYDKLLFDVTIDDKPLLLQQKPKLIQ